MPRNVYVRTCVKFTFANKIKAVYERSHVSIKVETTYSKTSYDLLLLLLFFLIRPTEPISGNAFDSKRKQERS